VQVPGADRVAAVVEPHDALQRALGGVERGRRQRVGGDRRDRRRDAGLDALERPRRPPVDDRWPARAPAHEHQLVVELAGGQQVAPARPFAVVGEPAREARDGDEIAVRGEELGERRPDVAVGRQEDDVLLAGCEQVAHEQRPQAGVERVVGGERQRGVERGVAEVGRPQHGDARLELQRRAGAGRDEHRERPVGMVLAEAAGQQPDLGQPVAADDAGGAHQRTTVPASARKGSAAASPAAIARQSNRAATCARAASTRAAAAAASKPASAGPSASPSAAR
jgi:hypothetical protein